MKNDHSQASISVANILRNTDQPIRTDTHQQGEGRKAEYNELSEKIENQQLENFQNCVYYSTIKKDNKKMNDIIGDTYHGNGQLIDASKGYASISLSEERKIRLERDFYNHLDLPTTDDIVFNDVIAKGRLSVSPSHIAGTPYEEIAILNEYE